MSVLNAGPVYRPMPAPLFAMEERFDWQKEIAWMESNWKKLLYMFPLYYVAIYFLKAYMDNRSRIEIRKPLVLWNFTLSAFSAFAFIRIIPEMIYCLKVMGFQYSVCIPSYATENKVTGTWLHLLCWSRAFELVDTFFIILRKRKLTFLHLYHHSIVCIYIVFVSTFLPGFARWIGCLNSFIHGVMYLYFGLRALDISVPKKVAMFITTLQIMQMVVGSMVIGTALHFKHSGYECPVHDSLIKASIAVGISLFVLFFNFFVQSYIKNERENRERAKNVKLK